MSSDFIRTHSAGGVILNGRGEVAVVSQYGTTWSLPKGHLESDEDPLTAAKREIYEETGLLELEFIRELGAYERYRIGTRRENDTTELKLITMFLFYTTQDVLAPIDPRNPAAIWVPKYLVSQKLSHPKDKAFFKGVVDEL